MGFNFPEGTYEFMTEVGLASPRESFMQRQGFKAADAYSIVGQKDGTIIFTYGIEDLLVEAGKMERPTPSPVAIKIGAVKQHKELIVFDENFSEEKSRKELLREKYLYNENGKEKEIALIDKVSGLFAAYLKMPEAKIDATQIEFLQSFVSLYKIKDELEPEVYQNAYDYLLNRFIESKASRIEEFQKKYNINCDIALEAKITKQNIFGTQVWHPVDFSLYAIEPDGNSRKCKLDAEFQDLAYALAINEFSNLLLLDIEAQKEAKKDVDNTINKLTKEVFGGEVYVKPCQKV